jgi:hypothetical protein
MDNILAFPESKIVRHFEEDDITREEISTRVELMHHLHIQEVVETLMPLVFSQLAVGGFDLSDEEDLKDAAFITEAIRSVLCKTKGINHPFQEIADQVFLDEDDGVFSMVESLNIKFNRGTTTDEDTDTTIEEATPT